MSDTNVTGNGGNAPGFVSVTILFLVWSFLAVVARLWAKGFKTRDEWVWDDGALCIAFVSTPQLFGRI
jgi:hypothetical protein